MDVRVITPPEPIVTPGDIPGPHSDADPALAALIAAVTEEIDGPDGWLCRSLGPQTLEFTGWLGKKRNRLPFGPVISIERVETIDEDGNVAIVDSSAWRREGDEIVAATGAAWVTARRHRVRYVAGYNGTTGATGEEAQTGAVPERARQAIILSVQDLLRTGSTEAGIRSETVEGVGTQTFLDGDKMTAIVERTCNRLLATLKVYSL